MEARMTKSTVSDEQLGWISYVIGWTAPEIARMLDSDSILMRSAALGLLDMAGIDEETFRSDCAGSLRD
jgi:hypothetical protein